MPIRIRAERQGEHIAFHVDVLRWADPVTPPPRDDGPLDARLEALEARLEALRPRGGLVARSPRPPDEPDHSDLFAFIEHLATLRERLSATATAPDEPHHAVQRVVSQIRLPGRRWGAFLARDARARSGMRVLLADLLRESPGADADPTDLVDLAAWRVDAVVAGPRPGVLHVRSAAREPAGMWSHAEPLLVAWQAAVTALGGALAVEEVPGGRRLVAHGAGLPGLLAGEEGLHWFYPSLDAPFALEVQADPEGDAPRRRLDRIVRLYSPSGSAEPGSVTDLRTGDTVRWDALPDHLPGWWLAAARST